MTNQERLLALNYVLDEQFKILRNVLSHITFKQFNVSVYLNNSQNILLARMNEPNAINMVLNKETFSVDDTDIWIRKANGSQSCILHIPYSTIENCMVRRYRGNYYSISMTLHNGIYYELDVEF